MAVDYEIALVNFLVLFRTGAASQGRGGLFSSKFVVLFKQRCAPQTWRFQEILGRKMTVFAAWSKTWVPHSSSGYTKFHAVSKMGTTLSAGFRNFRDFWKNLKRRRSHWRFQGDFASWGMPFDYSQQVLNPADVLNFHRVWKSPHITARYCLQFMFGCHMLPPNTWLDSTYWCSYQSRLAAPGPVLVGFWMVFSISQVRLRWISVQSDVHCALKWELRRIAVVLALIWA